MAPVPLTEGDIVKYKSRVCLLSQVVQTNHAYRMFKVVDLDTGNEAMAYRHEVVMLQHADEALGAVGWGDEEVGDGVIGRTATLEPTEPQPGPSTSSNDVSGTCGSRWANRSETEVDELASNRHSQSTVKQTTWAVRMFRGESILKSSMRASQHDDKYVPAISYESVSCRNIAKIQNTTCCDCHCDLDPR